MDLPVLYGMRASLYSAKARSYLCKQGIAHVELPTGDPRYAAEVMPAIGRMIMPVVQLPDGTLIQDTVDIIDHFDAGFEPERAAHPPGGVIAVLAHVLELFGGEGLMRPAMHYRWNFDEVNLGFLFEDFGHGLVPDRPGGDGGPGPDQGEARKQVFEFASGLMRTATSRFGVNEETIPQVEESYARFLAILDRHLEEFPYLLGGRPTLGDFAFMGPLYAHLSRDPAPSMLMKRDARQVWRWTERMMSPVADTGEYGRITGGLFDANAIPASLVELLAWFAEESLPELVATVSFIDRHISDGDGIGEGEVVGGKPSRRSIGLAEWEWRGHTVQTLVLPYRMTLLQRIQQEHEGLGDSERQRAREILSEAGLEQLLELKARRSVVRRDNIEVWGPEQQAYPEG